MLSIGISFPGLRDRWRRARKGAGVCIWRQMETVSPSQNFARKPILDPDRTPSPPCIAFAFALQMSRKLLQNQNSFFPKKLEEKGATASLGLANNLGNLTPFSCINAHVLMNNHFGIRAVEHNPWADFTLANEYIPMFLETAEPDFGDPEVNGDPVYPGHEVLHQGVLGIPALNGSQRPMWRKIFSCLTPPYK